MAAAGAARAASPAEAAVAASPWSLMCVTDYPAADEVLAAPGVLDALAGRDFVQLTNGSDDQVRDQLARVRPPAAACWPAASSATRGTSGGRRR